MIKKSNNIEHNARFDPVVRSSDSDMVISNEARKGCDNPVKKISRDMSDSSSDDDALIQAWNVLKHRQKHANMSELSELSCTIET